MARLIASDLDLKGKKVLARVDFSVPIKNGAIGDNNRTVVALSAIKYIIKHGGKAALLNRLGRVKSDAGKKGLSLRSVAEHLSELLKKSVTFVPEDKGREVEGVIDKMRDGDVIILENTRFQDIDNDFGKCESEDGPRLGEYWAGLGDVLVNDISSITHRDHASNVGITTAMRKADRPAATGLLFGREIGFLGDTVENPVHPFITVLGGAKVPGKIDVIESLIPKSDHISIGGDTACTFLAAWGHKISKSLFEANKVELARELLARADDKIVLPVDSATTTELSNDVPYEVVGDDIPDNEIGLDIGPKTVGESRDILKDAKTVVWNGSMGVFEMPDYAEGTLKVDHTSVDLKDAITTIGGGDSTAATRQLRIALKTNHISTGGGASLSYLEGKELPGITRISDK